MISRLIIITKLANRTALILMFFFLYISGCSINGSGESGNSSSESTAVSSAASTAGMTATVTLTEAYPYSFYLITHLEPSTGTPGFYDYYSFLTNINSLPGSQGNSTIIYNRITYNSSDNNGNGTVLSGCFFYNYNNSIKSPIVLYTHGTEILRTNVPSYFTNLMQDAAFNEAVEGYILSGVLGWTLVMPDYQGLGSDTNEFHPYCAAGPLGNSSADALESVINYVKNNTNIGWNGQVFVMGYSEGGYVSLAAVRELESRGIKVDAAIAMEGPYDLSGAMRNSFLGTNAYPYPYFLPYFIMGYNAVYGMAFDPYRVFIPQYSSNLVQYTDGWHDYPVIDSFMPSSGVMASSLQPSFISNMNSTDSSAYQFLCTNDLWRGWNPSTTIEVIHCMSDDCVSYSNFIVLSNSLAGNSRIKWLTEPVPNINYYGTIHASVAPKCTGDGISWLVSNETLTREAGVYR